MMTIIYVCILFSLIVSILAVSACMLSSRISRRENRGEEFDDREESALRGRRVLPL
jgi:hypothetical protein